eukprot:450898-Pyramimonas_sp.AAC.1
MVIDKPAPALPGCHARSIDVKMGGHLRARTDPTDLTATLEKRLQSTSSWETTEPTCLWPPTVQRCYSPKKCGSPRGAAQVKALNSAPWA